MPIPPNIDLDKLLTYLLSDATAALNGWLDGVPTDEVALMNHLTGRLGRRRRGCDVGVNSQVTVTSRSASLHRQGRNRTDLYGGDLAVSVLISDPLWSKTALFQLKKGSNFELVLERRQLLDSQKTQYSRDRSFVLYADLQRTGIKIARSSDLLREFDGRQETKQFSSAAWWSLSEWFTRWFSCELAPTSDPNNLDSIESRLLQLEHEPLASRMPPSAVEQPLPPFAWLLEAFHPAEVEIANTRWGRFFHGHTR